MNNTHTNRLNQIVEEVLDYVGFVKNTDGMYEEKLREYCTERLSIEKLKEIFKGESPCDKLYEIVCNLYEDAIHEQNHNSLQLN